MGHGRRPLGWAMVPPEYAPRPGGGLVRPEWAFEVGHGSDWLEDLVRGRGPLLEVQQEPEEEPEEDRDVLDLTDAILHAQLDEMEDASEPGEPDLLLVENHSQPLNECPRNNLDLPVVETPQEPPMVEVQETSETAAVGVVAATPVGEEVAAIVDLPGPARCHRGVQAFPGIS